MSEASGSTGPVDRFARLPHRALAPRPIMSGVDRALVRVGEVQLAVAVAGQGPPVLLLHGYPQTHVMWRHVVARLRHDHTLVVPDLRGYGESAKPPGDPRHVAYSKRSMAADMLRLMQGLGWERFAVVGHDRGARVGHRLALDAAGAVEALGVLDIVPTHYLFNHVERELADGYFHWFFLTQPDLPERLIGADVEGWTRWVLDRWASDKRPLEADAVDEYVVAMSRPGAVHASCEDYRAAATVDLDLDDADIGAGRKVRAPLLALWGEEGRMGRLYDVGAIWTDYADEVSARAVSGGHFVAEEAPDETAEVLAAFLRDPPAWEAAL